MFHVTNNCAFQKIISSLLTEAPTEPAGETSNPFEDELPVSKTKKTGNLSSFFVLPCVRGCGVPVAHSTSLLGEAPTEPAGETSNPFEDELPVSKTKKTGNNPVFLFY
ncbi:hypothetical protein [Eubacterium oxidoreducens]|uniref:hypothetical protein n=1 Tax=Eubacterium oxidoreducens TaxID=1732 RepID=UPI000B7EDD95|nr:hypothetical protein [Eubacterium oxidoreducens]